MDLLSSGDVPTALRYLHYVLLEWSLPIAKELIQHGHMYVYSFSLVLLSLLVSIVDADEAFQETASWCLQ